MNLESVLQQRGIPYEKHRHETTYTAQGLAQAERVSGYEVAKPVIVKSGAEFVMCVLPAPLHVDLKRVANLLHQPNARLAVESEMKNLFGDCELGAEPPVGELFGLRTIMDERLREDEYVVMQAGTHTDAIRLRREDYEKLAKPTVAAIAAGS